MTDLNGKFPLASVDPATNKVILHLATAQIYTGGGTWARVAPHNTAGMSKRIYRSLTTSSGTEFQYVTTVTADTTAYSDTTADNNLGEVLPSASWSMPPANLKGIIILANGIACGFRENEVSLL